MGVVSGLAGVVRFFKMMVDADDWPVYVLDRSIAVLFVHIVLGTLNCGCCNREVTSLLRWPLAQVLL